MHGLRWIGRSFIALGKLLAPGVHIIGKLFERPLRTLYHIGFTLKQRTRRFWKDLPHDFASLSTSHAAVVGLIIVITFFVAAANIRASQFAQENPLAGTAMTDLFLPVEGFVDVGVPTGAIAAAPLVTDLRQGALTPVMAMPIPLPDFSGEYSAVDERAFGVPNQPIDVVPTKRTEVVMHIIQTGETISAIAGDYGVSVQTLLWANKLSAYSILSVGSAIRIPPTNGVFHKIVRGQTLASIAKTYGVTVDAIREANAMDEDAIIAVGQELFIPGGTPPPAPAVVRRPVVTPAPAALKPGAPGSGQLFWPVASRRITQYYSIRHSGLDIGAPQGTPVYAADDGVVVSAIAQGWNGGYGRTILLDHQNGLRTRYGHLSVLYDKSGDRVIRGQVIALSGSTGRSTGPHLHFEVLTGGRRTNPLAYIR